MAEGKKSVLLSGQSAGKTAICTVGREGKGLHYRGYSIQDLAEHATFEEVAYLLLYGALPTKNELEQFSARLMSKRALPLDLAYALQKLPESSHPMDVMRTGCSMLGGMEPERSFEQQHEIAERLLAVFPSILMYWYQWHRTGRAINVTLPDERTIAGHVLHL